MIKKTLFQIARSPISRHFIGFAFAKLSFLMLFTKLINTPDLMVFHHPVKHWQHHLLIVPKTAVPAFTSLNIAHNPAHQKLLLGIVQAAQQAAHLEALPHYALLVNGGTYQDVPQMHFHLAAGPDKHGKNPSSDALTSLPDTKQLFIESSTVQAYQLPSNSTDFHIAIMGKEPYPVRPDMPSVPDENKTFLIHVFELAHQLIQQLKPPGYTLFMHGGQGQGVFAIQIRGIID